MAKSSVPIPKATRGGPKGYLREVRMELGKVDWPKPKETSRHTGIVFAILAIAGTAIFLMSTMAEFLINLMQGKR